MNHCWKHLLTLSRLWYINCPPSKIPQDMNVITTRTKGVWEGRVDRGRANRHLTYLFVFLSCASRKKLSWTVPRAHIWRGSRKQLTVIVVLAETPNTESPNTSFANTTSVHCCGVECFLGNRHSVTLKIKVGTQFSFTESLIRRGIGVTHVQHLGITGMLAVLPATTAP